MDDDWRSYLWLPFLALCASAFRWHDIAYDSKGSFRWGVIVFQVPTAFAIGTVAHAATPTVLHFAPYAGPFVAEGLAGVLAFTGPLFITRLADGVLSKFGVKP